MMEAKAARKSRQLGTSRYRTKRGDMAPSELQNRCSTAELNRRIKVIGGRRNFGPDAADLAGRIPDLPAKGQNPARSVLARSRAKDGPAKPPSRNNANLLAARRGTSAGCAPRTALTHLGRPPRRKSMFRFRGCAKV